MMGIKFPENFNFPYIASSPKDFWKRWHISLSSWIRDYLYLPLTGTVVSNKSSSLGGLEQATQDKKNKALFLTWAIMGLWHGASWTFVLWGLYHSAWIFLFRLLNKIKIINVFLSSQIRGFLITLPLMMLGWIPFRAESLDTTFSMWAKVIDISAYGFLSMRENAYLVAALLLTGFISTFTRLKPYPLYKLQLHANKPIRWIIYYILIIIMIRYAGPKEQFIYFQF